MKEALYELMDWAGIEAIVYSEEDHPHNVLGRHETEKGTLFTAFFPHAEKAEVLVKLKKDTLRLPMEAADEAGFFAALLEGGKDAGYRYEITDRDGHVWETEDPYRFDPVFDPGDGAKFTSGICYDLYRKLGAHLTVADGVSGVSFTVWAPNALRVSLVGDFNAWDGRCLPMRRLDDFGIFELFVPGLTEGTIYKYEIKAKGGLTYLKADPCASFSELRPGTASVVWNCEDFKWSDEQWMAERKEQDPGSMPLNIYEVHLGSFAQKEDGSFYNYRELAPMLAGYVRNLGYTHIELMPVMEYPSDESMGYQTTGYYAPTSRYGSPDDFMFFMNYMHRQGIGVILDWVCSQFPRDLHGLGGFDGTCLYEHQDPRQGVHPSWNTLMYNYGRPEVSNFLIGSALCWLEVYHADGLRLNDTATVLYLDNSKSDGQWVANIYGGNENLEGAEFLKHLNSIVHRRCPGVMMIAEESRGWPGVTRPLDEGGLGFDFKWNDGFTSDLFNYMQLDPIFRGHHHNELTFSMVYHYSENYLLALSHDEIVYHAGSFALRMPGKPASKRMNLKAMLGYMMLHPGKKLLFMGQEFASDRSWNALTPIRYEDAAPEQEQVRAFVKALNSLYRSGKALYLKDYDPDGFEWINEISANENMLVFLRKTGIEDETVLVVLNFSSLVYENHKIGVPFPGKYKEILNSDRVEYGGSGHINARLKNAKADECDGRPFSIRITVPPMGVSVFSCTKTDYVYSENEKARGAVRAKDARKKVTAEVKAAGADRKKLSLKDELALKVEQEEPVI